MKIHSPNMTLFLIERAKANYLKNSTSLLQIHWTTNRNSSSTKDTHYDTLEISPNATRSEIKTAYYKLTKQYHPDVNKSHEAKVKFQDVSNAYEVLSDHNSRKKYDRGLTIKQGQRPTPHSHTSWSRTYAPDASRYAPSEPPSHPIFDFDKWAKRHYVETLEYETQQKYNRQRAQEKREKNEWTEAKDAPYLHALMVGATIAVICMLVSHHRNPYFKGNVDQTNRGTD